MVVNWLNIISLLFVMTWCIKAQPPRKPPDLRREMVELLRSCFIERLNPVVTTPELYDTFLEVSWKTLSPPMILIDHRFKTNKVQQHYPRLATFVFAPYSVKSFAMMLMKVRGSPWWNEDAMFFIIGNLDDGCKSAGTILKMCWKMNLLSVLVLCRGKGRDSTLYTFNPYNNQAPHPWMEIGDSDKSDSHGTIFNQTCQKARKSCASLMFNKATFGNEERTGSSDRPGHAVERIRSSKLSSNEVEEDDSLTILANIMQNLLSGVDLNAVLDDGSQDDVDGGGKIGFVVQLMNKLFSMNGRDLGQTLIGNGSMGEINFRFLVLLWAVFVGSVISVGLVIIIHRNLEPKSNALTKPRHILSGNWNQPRKLTIKNFLVSSGRLIFILTMIIQSNYLIFHPQFDYYHDDSGNSTFYQSNFDGVKQEVENNFGNVGIPKICQEVLRKMLITKFGETFVTSKSDLDKKLSHWCSEAGPLKDQINRVASVFRQMTNNKNPDGTNWNFKGKYFSGRYKNKKISQYHSIELGDLAIPFAMLLCGTWISTVIFTIEISWQLISTMKRFLCKLLGDFKNRT